MKIMGVIPARMESSRFPGKPLADILGMPMIGHVYHRCKMSSILDEVYVATCNNEIFDYIESLGGKAIMTANTHERASDRVAEALSIIEEDADQKAVYYLGLADAYRHKGSYAAARNAVNSALELRSGWGQAYMSLGNIYIAGAKACGGNYEKSTVYWVAVDTFRKALSDEDTKYRASKSINTYSKYFPTKETCFFKGVEVGKSHTVGCWINKTTRARTSD